MHPGSALDPPDIGLRNIDPLDTHLDALDTGIPANIPLAPITSSKHLQDMSSKHLQDIATLEQQGSIQKILEIELIA